MWVSTWQDQYSTSEISLKYKLLIIKNIYHSSPSVLPSVLYPAFALSAYFAQFSSDGKASAYSVGDPGLIPGSGRSFGEGNDNLLQYSCLESPMDRGAWQATVHGVAKHRTRLSDFTSAFLLEVKLENTFLQK